MRSNRYENGLFILMTMKLIFTRKVFQSYSLVLTVLEVNVLRTPKWPIAEVHRNPPYSCPGARFSKVPIINGPGKLSPFTLKIEASIVLHLA